MDNYDDVIRFVNDSNKKRIEDARMKSLKSTRINYNRRKRKKINRNRLIAALLGIAIISSAISIPKINQNRIIRNAINEQKHQIAFMLENDETNFSEEQILGMYDLFGVEGVNIVCHDMGYTNWENWCSYEGYFKRDIGEDGNVINQYPDLHTAINYLEAQILEKCNSNGGISK